MAAFGMPSRQPTAPEQPAVGAGFSAIVRLDASPAAIGIAAVDLVAEGRGTIWGIGEKFTANPAIASSTRGRPAAIRGSSDLAQGSVLCGSNPSVGPSGSLESRTPMVPSAVVHRRAMWARLSARPGGFPWVQVAGHTWQGWIVIDVDASLVESHSDKQGAAATYKKHVFGLHPIVVSCANTGEILAVLLRAGNAGCNTVADHIAVLGEALTQLPALPTEDPTWVKLMIIFRPQRCDLLRCLRSRRNLRTNRHHELVEKSRFGGLLVPLEETKSIRYG
jgi:hypothetical protein